MKTHYFYGLVLGILTALTTRAAEITINDADGTLAGTRAPVVATVKLSSSERRAAGEGRLQLYESRPESASGATAVPVQFFGAGQAGNPARLCWLMPDRKSVV